MRLELSEDKKRISLAIVDKDKDNKKWDKKCKLMSWDIKTLKEVAIPQAVLDNTQELPSKSTLKLMKFVGRKNCCILQILKQTNDEAEKKNKEFFLTYRIFDAETGEMLLDWSNNQSKDRLKVLCLLTNPKVSKRQKNRLKETGE